MYPRPIDNLINFFSRLPGVGPKTAQRFVFYLLKKNPAEWDDFCRIIQDLRQIKVCSVCQNYSSSETCGICADKTRDQGTICLVSTPWEVEAVERTGEYKGVYEILGGLIDEAHNIQADSLGFQHFLRRLESQSGKIKEIIFAFSPTIEGEATSLYLSDLLRKSPQLVKGIKLTRLAKGLSSGSELEYADSLTLSEALKGRQNFS